MERAPHTSSDDAAALEPSQLLNLAQTHLRLRNFALSRQYSLELLSSAAVPRSLRATASQTLALSDVLSADDHHYAALQLDSLSSDPNLIRTQFKKLSFILQPIKHSSPFARQALLSLQRAFDCLSDPTRKAHYDAQLLNCMASGGGGGGAHNGGAGGAGFWTFCPYCFYVYEYDRVYEGCSLRCQNSGCRRVFDGVALTSLPKMELKKGRYFGCFGYFPMGFSPGKEGDQQTAKFESWSPIVGLFPANKKPSSNSNGVHNGAADFIEILDESDESEIGVKGGSSEGNVGSGIPSDRPRGMRRKSVALNARRKRKNNVGDGCSTSSFVERLFSDEDADFGEDFGMENDRGVEGGDVSDLNEGDMAFFEGDGEIFVGLGSDD